MYHANMRFPGSPDPRVLASALEALALSNCFWTLDQWEQGVDPPCCLECAGVVWVPDSVGASPTFVGLPDMLRTKRASCGSIAAGEAGRKQAEAIRDGASVDEAVMLYGVELVDGGEAYGIGGPLRRFNSITELHRSATPQQAALQARSRMISAPSGPGYGSTNLRSSSSQARSSLVRRRQLASDVRASDAGRYWHAVVRTPTGLHDPTKDMVRG